MNDKVMDIKNFYFTYAGASKPNLKNINIPIYHLPRDGRCIPGQREIGLSQQRAKKALTSV